MKIYPGTSFWDAYQMPLPIRKWLIDEHVRQANDQEQAQRQQGTTVGKSANVPLSNAEKRMITNQIQPMQSVKK